MSDELKEIERINSTEVLTAFNRIPYGLINAEVEGPASDTFEELSEIMRFYSIYKNGIKFTTEGTNGDYVPASLRYKMSASLINKEARFLFAEPPTIQVESKGDLGEPTSEGKDAITVMNDLVKTVLDANNFEDKLMKAAKDCFIGKRVACLVNFNEQDGVTITFVPSTQFLYETRIGNPNILTKLVCFDILKDSLSLSDKRIFKKKYTLEGEGDTQVVYLEEELYDGGGHLLEEVTARQPILLDRIPACIIVNDGLSGERDGESEVKLIAGYEKWYSKLSNADIDAERKGMNPIRYTVDMESNSTKDLSTSPGSYWDLATDQNADKTSPSVGTLENSMSYSTSLDTTLKRIKESGFEQLDVPNISLESMSGTITSGKALKSIYWPLIVRCKEKMKTWGPQLRSMVSIIIDGGLAYPNCIMKHVNDQLVPAAYEVSVEQNIPLQEDEVEEKNMDLAEVTAQTMSRKAYMKKWRGLTDSEVDEELAQIAYERQTVSDAMVMPSTSFSDILSQSGDISSGADVSYSNEEGDVAGDLSVV